MLRRNFFLITFLDLCIILSLTMVVGAQENGPRTISDDEVNAIAKKLYCPVCENIPLDACGTQACIQWRELIREKLALGWNEDEIKDYFVLHYGDRVMAEPPRRGLNLLVYIVPPVAFLTGLFILYRGIQSWRKMENTAKDHDSHQVDTDLDEYISRLEEELQQVEK